MRRKISSVPLACALFLIACTFLFGNPVSANLAKIGAEKYLKDKYGDLDLVIEKVGYNPKDSVYYVEVGSKTGVDTHFSLGFKGEKIFKDSYEMSVVSGMNTMDRFKDEYKKRLVPLVQEKTDAVVNISVIPEKSEKYGLELDSPFDKKQMQNVEVVVTCEGSVDAEFLSEVLKATYAVMEEEGYPAQSYGILGVDGKLAIGISNILARHIQSENLSEILQETINGSAYDGITSFKKGLK